MDNKDYAIIGLIILVVLSFAIVFVGLVNSGNDLDVANDTVNINKSDDISENKIPKADQPSSYGDVAVTFEEANSKLAHTPEYAAREMFNQCDENGDGILSGMEYDDFRYMVSHSQYSQSH